MQARHIALAAGAAFAISAAPALAQQNDQNRPTDTRNRTTLNQPGNRDADAAKRSTLSYQPNQPVESVLKDLQGCWTVQVSMNPEFFNAKAQTLGFGNQDARDAYNKDRNNDKNYYDNNKNDDNKNNTNYDSNKNNNDRNAGDNNMYNQPGMRNNAAGTDNMPKMRGYAEFQPIFGGNIIQEDIVIPDLSTADASSTTSSNAAAIPGDRAENMPDYLRGMCFIAFDPDSQTYSITFMDNLSGDVHHDTGTYDATARRIVFNGSSAYDPDTEYHGMTPRDRNSWDANRRTPAMDRTDNSTDSTNDAFDRDNDRNRTGLNDNDRDDYNSDRDNRTTADNSGKSPQELANEAALRGVDRTIERNRQLVNSDRFRNSGAFRDVQVVLEMVDQNNFKVTMYKGGSPYYGYNNTQGLNNTNINDKYISKPGEDAMAPGDRNANNVNTDPNKYDKNKTDADKNLNNKNSDKNMADRGVNRAQPLPANAGGGRIVYQAVYTRASDSDAQTCRTMLSQHDIYDNAGKGMNMRNNNSPNNMQKRPGGQ